MPRFSIFLFSLLPVLLVIIHPLPAMSATGITRLQVELPPELAAHTTSWWRSLLGIRTPRPVRPAVGTKFTVHASAYASSPYQTDATPCVTAAGTTVRPGVVAANFLPVGTLLDISSHKFIVEDRMHPRYAGYFLDVWFPSTSQAREFGRRKLEVTIIGYGEVGQSLQPSPPPATKKAVTLFNWLSARVVPNPDRYDVDCHAPEDFVRFEELTKS